MMKEDGSMRIEGGVRKQRDRDEEMRKMLEEEMKRIEGEKSLIGEGMKRGGDKLEGRKRKRLERRRSCCKRS